MATRNLKIHFYEAQVVDPRRRSFEDILAECAAMPDDLTRTSIQRDAPVRLHFARKHRQIWTGEMIRIRLNEEIKKAKVSGGVEPIHFEEDEGLGEATAFLYDPEYSLLVMHDHGSGVSPTGFARYLKQMTGVSSVQFQIFVKPDALERVEGMTKIKQVKVALAGIDHGRALKKVGGGARRFFDLAGYFRAPRAQFKLEVESGEATLDNVVTTIRELLTVREDHQEEVKEVVVCGSEGEDELDAVVNLLQDRIMATMPVDVEGKVVKDEKRHGAVYDAWTIHRPRIEEIRARRG